ncbi:hypothetical protein [Schaalia sp. ZJ1691]|uniref:hypothetical protein n=1 Tax=Schaalia sp. ZJ1691 TaxID=2709404 RepID=UPI0013ED8E21|nr:hypothetical protein [Schaalia sp. ZJ1691]
MGVLPVLWGILVLSDVQGAIFAGDSAAREAVRILSTDPTAKERAMRQVSAIFSDFGRDPPNDVAMNWGDSSSLQPEGGTESGMRVGGLGSADARVTGDGSSQIDGFVDVTIVSRVNVPLVSWIAGDRASITVRSHAGAPVESVALVSREGMSLRGSSGGD